MTQPVTRCIFGDVTSPSPRASPLSACCWSGGGRVCIPLTSCFVIALFDSSSCEPSVLRDRNAVLAELLYVKSFLLAPVIKIQKKLSTKTLSDYFHCDKSSFLSLLLLLFFLLLSLNPTNVSINSSLKHYNGVTANLWSCGPSRTRLTS